MIAVIGHWEWRDMVPLTEAPLWNLPLRDFGVTDWRMIPVSGIRNSEPKVTLREFSEYADALQASPLRYATRVFIEPRTPHQNPDTTWLHDFKHPDDCVYVFGSAHYNPTLFHRREGDPVVTIETQQNKGVLWAHQAAIVTLYDRLVKRGDC